MGTCRHRDNRAIWQPKPHLVAAVRPSPKPNELCPSHARTHSPAHSRRPLTQPTSPPPRLPAFLPGHLPSLHRQSIRQTLGDKVPVLMISASRHLGLVHNCLAAGADMCAEPTPNRTRPILHGAEWLSPRLTLILTPDPKMTSPPDRDTNAGPGPDYPDADHASDADLDSDSYPDPDPDPDGPHLTLAPRPPPSRFVAKPLHVNVVEHMWQSDIMFVAGSVYETSQATT